MSTWKDLPGLLREAFPDGKDADGKDDDALRLGRARRPRG